MLNIHTSLKLLHCFLFSVIRLWQMYYQYLILFEFAVLHSVLLVQQGGDWAGLQPAQAPPHCTKCNSPPISAYCCIIVDCSVILMCPLKG